MARFNRVDLSRCSQRLSNQCRHPLARGIERRHDRTLKHSFRLVFRGIYGPNKLNFPLFPDSDVERFDQLVLRASSGDSWSYPDEYHHGAPEHIKEQAQYTRDLWMKDTQRAM